MGHGLIQERKLVPEASLSPAPFTEPDTIRYCPPFRRDIPISRADHPCLTHPFATLPGDCSPFTSDLHVLGTPPAFVLSQDQTLQFHLIGSGPRSALLLFSCQRSPLPTRPSFSTRFRANLLILPKRPFPVKPPLRSPFGSPPGSAQQGSILYAFPQSLSTSPPIPKAKMNRLVIRSLGPCGNGASDLRSRSET